jgi:hypothetical protein
MSIMKEIGKNMVDGLNLEKEMTWKNNVLKEMERRVFPGMSNKDIMVELDNELDYEETTPKEWVTDWIEDRGVDDLDDPWMR